MYLYNCMCDASASILGIGRNSRNRSKDSSIIDAGDLRSGGEDREENKEDGRFCGRKRWSSSSNGRFV